MPSKILQAYRENLAAQGLTDPRDDQFLVQELGPIIQSEAPHLFDQDPELGQLWSEIRDANAPSLPGEFGRAFKSGAQGLASTALGGASLLTGSDYLREKAASFDQDAAENAPTIPTLEDVAPGRTGISKVLSRDALRYVISKAGQVAPSIAEAGVTALAGAAAGSAAAPGPGTVAGAGAGIVARSFIKSAIRQLITKGVAKEMVTKGLIKEASEVALEQALKAGSKEVAEVVGRQAMSIGAKRGLTAANLANSYLLNAGDVYSEGGSRPAALGLGLISAIPDTVLPTYLLGRLFPGVAAEKAKDLGRVYLADRAKKLLEAGGVTATEGATEYFQEAVNVVARNLKEDKDPLTFTDADLKRFREAGITGAVGGSLAAPAILLQPEAGAVPVAPAQPGQVVPPGQTGSISPATPGGSPVVEPDPAAPAAIPVPPVTVPQAAPVVEPAPAAAVPAPAATPEAAAPTLASSLIGRRVSYLDRVGVLRRLEDGTLAVESGNQLVEVENAPKGEDVDVTAAGIQPYRPVSIEGPRVMVGDQNFTLPEDLTQAVNFDKDGNLVSVTLRAADGAARTIRDADIAFEIAEKLAERQFAQSRATPIAPTAVEIAGENPTSQWIDKWTKGFLPQTVEISDLLDLGDSVMPDGTHVAARDEYWQMAKPLEQRTITAARNNIELQIRRVEESTLSSDTKSDLTNELYEILDRLDRFESERQVRTPRPVTQAVPQSVAPAGAPQGASETQAVAPPVDPRVSALQPQPVAPLTPAGDPRPPAPVVYVGMQEGLPAANGRPAIPGFEIFNLTQDIPGHSKGSTVTRETLEKAGFAVPPVPAEPAAAAPGAPMPPADAAAEPTIAPPAAEPTGATAFEQGAVIEGAPSVDFRTNDQFLNFTPVQWQQALAASLEAGPRSDKTGNRSLTRVAVALQTPDGRVVVVGLTLPQKTLTTSGTTTFKEPALQRMGVSREGRRAVEAGGNHPATVQDVVAAGYRPLAVIHFAGEPTKIYQSFPDQKAFDASWGATPKTQGANIRPPAMTAQPAITRNREAEITRQIDQLGMELLRAKNQGDRQALVDQIKNLYGELEKVAGRDQLQIGETTIEENNFRLGQQQTVLSADRTNEFQAVMTNLRNMGMRVDLFAKEIFAQGAREPIVQQIQALQQQLATAQGGQRAELMARIAQRESRLADIDKAVGVAYSPWHIAVSVNDVQSSNLSNLVTLLHEAAESLTMRLGPVAKGNVLRAVDATMADLQAKAQAAAARTGVPAATTTSAADQLAETLAQKLAAEGVDGAPSLAQAIVRWVKDLYYRVSMAVQRGFGGEPDIETSLNWFENQLRREVGGDFDYRLTNLLDRYLVLPAVEQVRKFEGQKDTPGGVADFLDPLENQLRQPWVDPLTPDAMRWNVEFRQSDAPTDQNIPDPEARARIDSAAVNEVLELGKRLHAQVAPDMPWEQFWKLVGRGDDPVLLLADQERRVPGSQTARIGGERMTRPMNELASLNARILVEKMHLRQLREVARNKKAIAEAEAAMVAQAREMNKVEADFRNAALHEDTLRDKLKDMVRGLVRAIQRGYDTAHTHGRLAQAIRQAEGLLESDPMPEAYQRVLKQAADGTLPLFNSVRALAELDLPLAEMTNSEIVTAIRENAEANPDLQAMANNRPLAVAIAELARANIEQVDQIQLGWLRDTTKFREIHAELDQIRTATSEQLSTMIRKIDERANAKGLAERLKAGYLKRRRALQTQQNRIQIAEERVATLEKAVPLTAARVVEMQRTGGGAYTEWFPVQGAEFIAMVPGADGFTSEKRRLQFNPDGSAVDSDQIKRDITNNMEWLKANSERKGQKLFEQVKRQTMELAMLDIQRKYPAGWVSMLDKMVQPISAEARSAGHSSGARIAQMLQQFEFISRSHRDEVAATAGWWTRAFKDVEEATGIKDHGKLLSQLYDPVMYFLNVNPGLDEQHAIREAIRLARQLLPTPPAENFNEKFTNLLRRTKEASEQMLRLMQQYGVFVKDPRISQALRSAVAQGWLTSPRSLRADVVQTIVRDMEKAGWKLRLKTDTDPNGTERQSVVRATTFDGLSVEDLDPKNSEVLRPVLQRYFTPTILENWFVPFINKPGQEIFSWAGDPIPQMEVQQAWQKAGGNVLQFIDNLAAGRQLQVNEETAADPLADFRQNILGQIDKLFSMEAKLAYESQQVRDVFDPMGPKPHAMMDARLNELIPPEHLQFQAFDPTSSQRLLGLVAFHGAFGRNGERMVQTVNELKGVLSARKAEFDSLKGTTKGARVAEAAARGLDYRELEQAADRYQQVIGLQAKLQGLFGINNSASPFHDLRGGMEVMNAIAGQIVDQPKVGAYNLLSIAMRPFAMRSLGPMTISATARGYANFLTTALGSFLENLNVHLMHSSDYAKDVGSVEGQLFRNLPWGTVLADIGHRGRFQTSKTDQYVIKPLRALRAIQRKGVRVGIGEGAREFPRLAMIPGLGVLNSISQIAAQSNTLAQVQMVENIVRRGINYFTAHPEALHDPSFRFTAKQLKIGSLDQGVLDYLRNKTVEYGMGNLEDLVRHGAQAAAKGERLLTRDHVLRLAQMAANELDGASSINTTPSVLQTNPLLRIGMPLMRWPLWMMHTVHEGLNTADGQKSLKAMAKGLGTLALWNLPMGIAFSLLMDQYDDKILNKKSNQRPISGLAALPIVGPGLAFAASDKSAWDTAMGLLERSAKAGNVYGLGADLAAQIIAPLDPNSGQRAFSMDQRILVMSQFLNFSQSIRNLIAQGGDATWASVWRPAMMSIGGNGVLHSVDITNNLLGLDNAESRLTQRISAQNWMRAAGREIGLELRGAGGSSSAPTPMSVWTREMSLAAMANDRLGFLDAYRRALNAAREQVAEDPRIPPIEREKEAATRVLASWKSRDPMEVFRFKPSPAQQAQLYAVMDEDGRTNTQEAIRRFENFTQLIAPNPMDRYITRQVTAGQRAMSPNRMRSMGAGFLLQPAGR